MDIKTITATLALLGSGAVLGACDSAEKPAAEVDAAKKDKADAKDGKKDDAKTNAAAKGGAADKADKGEMSCVEGQCGGKKGEGSCGGHGDKAMADGAKADAKAAPPTPDDKADKS